MTNTTTPIAHGPLVELQRQADATIELRDGWEVAVRLPPQPPPTRNAPVDLSHWSTYEINGPATGSSLQTLCGTDVPLRKIHSAGGWHAYRLTPTRAIIFGKTPAGDCLDVTGGWTTFALVGPDAEHILNK